MSDDKRFLVVRIMVPRCTFEHALQYMETHDQVDGLSMLRDPTLLEEKISALRALVREAHELADPKSAIRLGDQIARWNNWVRQAEAALSASEQTAGQ